MSEVAGNTANLVYQMLCLPQFISSSATIVKLIRKAVTSDTLWPVVVLRTILCHPKSIIQRFCGQPVFFPIFQPLLDALWTSNRIKQVEWADLIVPMYRSFNHSQYFLKNINSHISPCIDNIYFLCNIAQNFEQVEVPPLYTVSLFLMSIFRFKSEKTSSKLLLR